MQGRMIQIVKHKALPINAIMLSKAGKMMAMITNMTITAMRIMTLSMPRVQEERPTRDSLSDTARESSPEKTSIVETMGRALRGTLVKGMIAMKMDIMTERTRG